MSNQEDLHQIELTIEQAKDAIDLQKAFNRLVSNSDFKKVIEERYFKSYAQELVFLKADPSMDTPEMQSKVIKDMDAIGALRMFFLSIQHEGRMAERAVAESEATREEILAEDL